MADFEVSKTGPITVVKISGRFTVEDKDEFMIITEDKIDLSSEGTCINTSDLKYIDSSGIGDLLKLKMEASKQNHTIYVMGLNEAIEKVFRMARLDSVFQMITEPEFKEKFG
jgi:anti-anti-sigma factor